MIFQAGNFIHLVNTRCLNSKHYAVECSHCAAHCPQHAIILSNHTVYLNHEACSGCGLCFSECPTDVFVSKQWDEAAIIEAIPAQVTTQIFCGKHSHPFKSAKDDPRAARQIPTCLAAISKGAWFEIAAKAPLELRLDQCADCPEIDTLDRLHHALQTASEWLASCNITPQIELIYEAAPSGRRKKLRADLSGAKLTSRRDLLLSLTDKGRIMADNMQKPSEKRQTILEPVAAAPEEMLPLWQQRFAVSYPQKQAHQQTVSPAFWPELIMNRDCVNCGMCAINCPTKAVEISIENDVAIHSFTAGICIDCRLCMLFCPTHSIKRERTAQTQPFEKTPIYQGEITKCKICGACTIKDNSADQLCYWCKSAASEKDLLMGVRQKIYAQKEQHREQH